MGKSLQARFNGNSQEVIEYARAWGKFKAMDKFGVKDVIAFDKFLAEASGDVHLGENPVIGLDNPDTWAAALLNAFTQKLLAMEAEKQRLSEQISKLSVELDYYKTQQALKLQPKTVEILRLCRT